MGQGGVEIRVGNGIRGGAEIGDICKVELRLGVGLSW